MADAPVIPAAPAAAPAPSAPTPAPAPAPSAPAPPTPPASPAATPETTPQPETSTIDIPGDTPAPASGEPKQEDYSQDEEGLERYLNDRAKFREEHPEAAKPADQPVPDATIEQPKLEVEAPKPPADAVAPSPQKIDEWSTKDPAFKAAIEANPELKGELFALARMNERAKPILDIVATPEEAQFAVEQANSFVELRTGLMLAVEDPQRLAPTFDRFQDLFRIKDAQGNNVLDAAGNVQMAEDYSLLRGQMVGDGFKSTLSPLKAKTEALRTQVQQGVFPSEAAKAEAARSLEENDYAVAALEYAEKLLNRQDSGNGPALPDLPADATPAQRELQEQLRKERDELTKSKQTNSREQRIAQRQEFTGKLNRAWGSGVGKMLDEAITAERSAGGVIPDFVLQEKWINPQTGQQTSVSNFAMNIQLEFNRKITSLPGVKQKLADLQLMPPGPDAEAAATSYYADLRTKYLPDIIKAHVSRIQQGILQHQGQRMEQRKEQSRVATIEPRSGSTPAPQTMTKVQMHAKAAENAKKLPGYADMSGEEQLEAELKERYKLQGLA